VQERIEYMEPLTGTLAETSRSEQLGVPFSPLQQMWQVNPGAEAVDPDDNGGRETKTR
jgi:hypothetical protein